MHFLCPAGRPDKKGQGVFRVSSQSASERKQMSLSGHSPPIFAINQGRLPSLSTPWLYLGLKALISLY